MRLLGRSFLLTMWMVMLIALARGQGAAIVLQQGLDGYEGCEDASLFQDFPANSSGGDTHIFAGFTVGEQERRALIRFDLSGVPADTQVTGASLRLVVNRTIALGAHDFALHRATSSWGEGNVDPDDEGGRGDTAEPGDATWTHRFHDTVEWATAGGDYVTTPSATATAGSVGTELVFSSHGMLEDILAWMAEPETNHGWVLIGEATGPGDASARRFGSSEGDAADRPRLVLILPTTATARSVVLGIDEADLALDRNEDGLLDSADVMIEALEE